MTRYWWSERIGPGFTHGYEIERLYEERTPYQKLLIFDNEQWGRGLILDGIVQVTFNDEFIYHEMMVHVPIMARSQQVESVLIIGGADGGILREVQKQPQIKRIVQVELDEAVLRACRKYLPEISGDWDDPRVELVIGDGAAYVQKARKHGEKFDLIILDSTDPIGPSIVLFEPPFHQDLAACLSSNGTIIRQSGLPNTMPKVMPFVMARFQDVLPQVEVYQAPMPTYGGEIAFVAASRDGISVKEPGMEFVGRYYNPETHRAAFALPTWWTKLIEEYEDNGRVPVEPLSFC